jgi:hypothetical protein
MPKETVEALTHAKTNGQQTVEPDHTRHEVRQQFVLEREEEIGCWDGIPQSA